MTGNGDEFRDQFDPGPRPPTGAQLSFGEIPYPWRSPPVFDGTLAPAPRRPELLGDAEDNWWADVTAWTEWAIETFGLGRWFPACWRRHPALVEEAQAMWLLWCDAYQPGVLASAPAGFLHNLNLALNRIDTLWQIPCTDSHTELPRRERRLIQVRPVTRPWSSIENFNPAATAW